MPDVTDDELLRLARLVWPSGPLAVEVTRDAAAVWDENGLSAIHVHHPRAREALHAALLVLAGELAGDAPTFSSFTAPFRQAIVE
jgi:hypothetical protein